MLAIGYIIALALTIFLYFGLFVVNPNQGKVLQLFGSYVGTVKDPGLRWANPLYTKKRVSLRVRNFETSKMKVNDNRGNPVEIAAVVVWKVVDTAEAIFEVDDYETFKAKLEDPGGFLLAHWCGDDACEDRVQEETKATIRCLAFDQPEETGACLVCGKTSKKRAHFARGY